jgi:hypothetical protein
MLYAKWEGPLRQARQETDHQELLRLAGEAELALFRRLQELPVNAAGHQETLAILADGRRWKVIPIGGKNPPHRNKYKTEAGPESSNGRDDWI